MARSFSSVRGRFLAALALLGPALGAVLLAQTGTPNITVSLGSAAVGLNSTVGFGSSPVGVASSKAFTVKNTGTANLLVSEAVTVPQGFTLMARFPGVPTATLPGGAPAYVLAPNATANFTVALNSATAGNFSGKVSFQTNVTGKNPFTFNVTGKAVPPPAVRIIDDDGAGFTATGGWHHDYIQQGASGKYPFQRFLTWAGPGTGTETATWAFTGLEPGRYRVSATWVGFPWGATNAPFLVLEGAKTLATVLVNQTADSAGFGDGASNWQPLGEYTITGTTLSVKMTNNANSYLNADAVRIERVGYPGTIIDDTDSRFTVTGTWTRGTQPGARDFQGRTTRATATPTPGTPTATGQWAFAVAPGTYRVMATYHAYSNNATNAPFTVLDGTTPLGTVRINQAAAPADLTDALAGWKDLGFFTAKASQLFVRLTNDANNRVTADAVRIERVNTPTAPSAADTARFLQQATWGPTTALGTQVQATGLDVWLAGQLNAPAIGYPVLPLYNNNDNVANNVTTSCYGDPNVSGNPARQACLRDHYSMYPLQNRFFTNALYGDDQLRQRMAWSLHRIWVVSGVDIRQSAWMAPYLSILNQNAFGNYRTLMYQVTLNPAMGNYLDMANSRKSAGAVQPNENYPRELLQLFTIGLQELNPDGTVKPDGMGIPIATYDQALVNEMSKVFTGWNFAPAPAAGIPNYIDPMRLSGAAVENPQFHDFSSKKLLRGFVQPARASSVANAYLDLNEALDNIYNHPNVAPFICKQLIQHLVTSNPSAAYIARVGDVFDRNRASATQLHSVVRAILLDPEARGDIKTAPNYGHLKEPVLLINNVLRAFDAKSADRLQNSDGYLNPDAVNIGQDTFRPPSVFSYFSPGKVAVGGNPPVIGPEFQIYTSSTALRRINFINQAFTPNSSRTIDIVRNKGTTPSGIDPATGLPLVPTGPQGTAVDVSFLLGLAGNPSALADELNQRLLHGTMTAEMKAEIVTAVTAVVSTNTRKRVRTAVYLVTSSSQYQVQK